MSRKAVFVSAAPLLMGLSLVAFLVMYFGVFDDDSMQAAEGGFSSSAPTVLPSDRPDIDSSGTVEPRSSASHSSASPSDNGGQPQAEPERELAGTVLTFLPVADSMVMAESPDENAGQSDVLRVDGEPIEDTYLKFELERLEGSNVHARLRLHTTNRSSSGGSIAVNHDAGWDEESISYRNRPSGEHVTIGTLGSVEEDQWAEVNVTPGIAGDGAVTFIITGTGTNGAEYSSRESSQAPQLIIEILPDNPSAALSPSDDPVIVMAAGDIACDPESPDFNDGEGTEDLCRQKFTADLVIEHDPDAVLMVGDAQYDNAEYEQFMGSYDKSWGAFFDKTYPVPGNHEYYIEGAEGYFEYFGDRAGDPDEGWYAFELEGWQFLAINSNCEDIGGCDHDSPQYEWLQQTLESNAGSCEIAYLHSPRWVSAKDLVDDELRPLYDLLYHYGVELAVSGHAHHYERFGPQDPAGNSDDAAGIRQFITGAGGAHLTSFETILPNSEARNNDTIGVLKLVLHDEWYEWEFVVEDGESFSDTGSGTCR